MTPGKAKKRTRPLALETALERVAQMVDLIEREVKTALQLEASLQAANDIVQSELRNRPFYGAECFATVKLATQIHLALQLAKLFERPGRRPKQTIASRFNTSDVASIPVLLHLLSQDRIRKPLQVMSRVSSEPAQGAVARYANLRSTHQGRVALKKLSAFRTGWLAHLLLTQSVTDVPTYNQLFLLMDAARDITELTLLAVRGNNFDLEGWEEERTNISLAFWKPALRAAVTENI